MIDRVIQDFFFNKDKVKWNPSDYDGIDWYYAENKIYVIRHELCGLYRYCFILAESPEKAVNTFVGRKQGKIE